MKLRRLSLALGVVAISSYVNASIISYSDLAESVSVTIDGVDIRQSPRASNVVFTGELVDFDMSLPNGDFITISSFTNLLEPGTTNTISDRYVDSFVDGALTYHVSIGSDPDLPAIPANATDLTTVPAQGLPPNPYFEDGTQQKVATRFLGAFNDTYFITSDIVEVPEPGTLVLVLSGLAGALILRRKSRQV